MVPVSQETIRTAKPINKITKIDLHDSDTPYSVNQVRASIVNYMPRPGAMSTDKLRPCTKKLLEHPTPHKPNENQGKCLLLFELRNKKFSIEDGEAARAEI
jgi:hypothetical protein